MNSSGNKHLILAVSVLHHIMSGCSVQCAKRIRNPEMTIVEMPSDNGIIITSHTYIVVVLNDNCAIQHLSASDLTVTVCTCTGCLLCQFYMWSSVLQYVCT